jgi:RimJ/RimL family protein N-acetyltransferase
MICTHLPIELNLVASQQQLMIIIGKQCWYANYAQTENTGHIQDWEGPDMDAGTGYQILDTLFHELNTTQIIVHKLAIPAFKTMHPAWSHSDYTATLTRNAFYQMRENWLHPTLWPVIPEQSTQTGDVRHPVRPSLGDHALYCRFVPSLGKTITLRQATIKNDGERFYQWQNNPRVARYWQYPWSRERLDAMLEERRADPHCLPLILEADNKAVGYFETYYVPEDRLGPYCNADAFDQGVHVLVGESEFLGKGQTPHWLNAVCHFMFLHEPRTRQLWGEPQADNQAMLRHTRTTSWEKLREFSFPHKRAALLCNERERFFNQTRL